MGDTRVAQCTNNLPHGSHTWRVPRPAISFKGLDKNAPVGVMDDYLLFVCGGVEKSGWETGFE